MTKWAIIVVVSAFLVTSFVVASRVNGVLASHLIGVSTSITVAVVGLWAFFKKSKF